MDVEKIRALRLAHPFRPFVIVLASGRRLMVAEPYNLAIAPDGSHMIYCGTDPKVEQFTGSDVMALDVLRASA